MNNKPNSEDNIIAAMLFRFVPFWPLFLALLLVSVFGAWAYLKYYATPIYGINASLLVKDEEKGVNESKMAESIDAFTSNKIVDNEINVLRSNALMQQVVNDLKLYAPISEESQFKSISAYTSSPIIITLKEPNRAQEFEKIYFSYSKQKETVEINNKKYPIDQWVLTPYGEMKFTINPSQNRVPQGELFFSINNPRSVAGNLLSKILIESPGKLSSIINLYFEDSVPERGQDILNALINNYQQNSLDERSQLAGQTLDFVENRIQLIEKELADLENKIVDYKSSNGAINLNEQGRMFLQNVGDNDRKMSELSLQLAVLDKVEKYVVSKNTSAGLVPSTLGINDPILSQLLQKLYDAEIKYQQLRKTTAENNPLLLSLKEEIESIRPSVLENIRNQKESLYASRAKVAATNSSYNSVLQSIPEKERELLEISRQQAIKNEAYSFLLQKREETVLSYAPTAEETKVIDMAEPTRKPVSPKSLYVYLSATILALGSGIGLVLSKELFHNKVLFRSEIENHINAPIVAELSTVKNSVNNGLFEAPSEISQIEQFRQLRVTMGLYGRTFTRRKIMVTSSIPGEGKSFVSTNLALSLSSSGKKTILVDFDLRNPSTSTMFNITQEKGVIEYLNEESFIEEIIKPTAFTNLSIISAGIAIGDHTELLLNGKLDQLFKYLEETYDYVIIDTPPIDLVSDAFLLTQYCDVSLLVIRHAYTPKNIIYHLSQNNRLDTLNNVAIIFNGVKPRGFVKGQFGYGYGYGYENKYSDKVYRSRKFATANEGSK